MKNPTKGISMTSIDDRQRWLRNSLLGNAVFSTVTGLIFALGAAPMASFLGLEQSILVRVVGLGLLGFAGFIVFVATRPEIDSRAAVSIVIGDLCWVVGTVPLAMMDVLSDNGLIAAIAIADIVLLFAGLQYYGVRRARGSASGPKTMVAPS
jgi:hypothetical protein